jgi:IS30 family transposase
MLGQAAMRTTYNQLTSQERDLIGVMLSEGRSIGEIAGFLGRDKATICREVHRNGSRIRRYNYLPHKAHVRSSKRRSTSRMVGRIRDERILEYVINKLRLRWSPETIAGRLPLDHPGLSISHEGIYQWIYSEGKEFIPFLTRRHWRRKRKGCGRKCHKYNIPQRVSIDERPEEVTVRDEAGHWEVDTAFFHHNREALHVMAERKTRYALLTKLKDITAHQARDAIIRRHHHTPKFLRKSFTYDNGRENVYHVYVNRSLGSRSYFCYPGRSYEKGTVENTIGLIRRFLPKKARFSAVSMQQLKIIEDWLNDRPRKCLDFRTPREAYRAERCTY